MPVIEGMKRGARYMTTWNCAKHTVGLDDAWLASEHAPFQSFLQSRLLLPHRCEWVTLLGVYLQGQTSGVLKLLVGLYACLIVVCVLSSPEHECVCTYLLF